MSETLKSNNGKSLWAVLKDVLPLITAIIGFIGGLVTGERRYLSDVQLQNQRYLLELRKDAYTNWFEGQAKLRQANQLEDMGLKVEADKLRREYELQVKKSRFQITIFGTKPVVDTLANYLGTYFNYGPCGGNRQQWIDDIQIYQNMRQEIFGEKLEQKIDDEKLLVLLFDCKLSEEPPNK